MNGYHSERDIEDYLFEHPELLGMKSWIARQFRVPSGVIDLLGEWWLEGAEIPNIVVVEIKKGPITASSIMQVTRYRKDIQNVINSKAHDLFYDYGESELYNIYCEADFVSSIVVGSPGVGYNTFLEADAIGVQLRTFEVKMEVEMSDPLRLPERVINDYSQEIDDLKADSIIASYPFDIVGTIIHKYKERQGKES